MYGIVIWILIFCSLFSPSFPASATNPFAITFPQKENLTPEDYMMIQKQLHEINIEPLLQEHFVADPAYTSFDDLKNRCHKGLKQILCDPGKGLLPVVNLEKIGNGSDMCIVSYSSYNKMYYSYIDTIPESLKKFGFNGYFYSRKGGYPNPTGKEVQYAGVPYAFKIFLMLEAQKLGFNKIIWLDASIQPLRDPTPLFAQLEKQGSLLFDYTDEQAKRCLFPKTRQLLKDLTTTDAIAGQHINTAIFGLVMDAEKVKKFIEAYYKYVEMGTPFISCYPEEFVFIAYMGQSPKDWPTAHLSSVLGSLPSQESKDGPYFYLRPH